MFKPRELKNLKINDAVDNAILPQEDMPAQNNMAQSHSALAQKSSTAPSAPSNQALDQAPHVEQQSTQNTSVYEGEQITDLQATGFKTIELLKVAKTQIDKRPRYNVAMLEKIPLTLVFNSFGASSQDNQSYTYLGYEFATKDNKWYNKGVRYGSSGAIALAKHLTAIKEDLNEVENQKVLFIAACRELELIQNEHTEEFVESASSDILAAQGTMPHVAPNKAAKEVNTQAPANTSAPAAQHVAQAENELNKNQKKPQGANKSNTSYGRQIDWKLLTDQLNQIPLQAVMEYVGANANEDGHRGKWKVLQTGHNVQVSGNMWKNWNSGEGGHGAISFLAEHISILQNINLRDPEGKKHARVLAIKELMKEFGSDFDSSLISAGEPVYKVPFSMPHVISCKTPDIIQYLVKKRGVPEWIVNKQIEAGHLFAGYPSDWKPHPHLKRPEKLTDENVWAVFLGINGNAAEMRAIARTDQYAKILASGSDKATGGFLIKAERTFSEKKVVALEAALDSMSYHAFYPGRVTMSCMGVNFALAVSSALEALDAGYKFELAFDNDKAGNNAAVSFKKNLIEEIGEDSYKELVDKEQIKFFDLGIRTLKHAHEQGESFYFAAMNDDTGREACSMFREQLFKSMPKEEVLRAERKGKIRYLNISPSFYLMRDPVLEARNAVDLLNSGKPYYFLLEEVEADDKGEKPAHAQHMQEEFQKHFAAFAGDNLEKWEKDGRVIYESPNMAKDWNEYLLYRKQEPAFIAQLVQQEKDIVQAKIKSPQPSAQSEQKKMKKQTA